MLQSQHLKNRYILGDPECVKLLLKYGSDVTVEAGENQITPLQEAVVNDKVEVVEIIFKHLFESNKLDEDEVKKFLSEDSSTEMNKVIVEWSNKKMKKRAIKFENPELFCFLSSLAIQKYCAVYRLHAAKTVFKGLVMDLNQSQMRVPLLDLGIQYPWKISHFASFPWKISEETFCTDFSEFSKVVSKSLNPGLELGMKYLKL